MEKETLKNKTKSGINKLKNKIWTIPISLMLLQTKVFATQDSVAEGSISIAEVKQATENIKNAVIKLAMPIRRNFSICKYCNYCIKNDS